MLIDNPLLLLFVVSATGFLVGRIKIGGFRLGIAAVLFVGLAIGSLDPAMRLPDIVFQFGLIVFVYTVGLAGGPGFFAALRREGVRDNLLVLGVILVAAGMVVAASAAFDLVPGQSAGLFSGSLTNTPALATVLQYITDTVPATKILIAQLLLTLLAWSSGCHFRSPWTQNLPRVRRFQADECKAGGAITKEGYDELDCRLGRRATARGS